MRQAPQAEAAFLAEHLVRYGDLIPCTTAFIDTRTPGSQEKENFTIIGPGVAENPDQHVHIKRPHGFNIGGARQPPHCVNSQHSHDTAEVFVVLSGRWSFTTGEHGKDGAVEIGPGDTISLPTKCFRGFENVGDEPGFLFAVLGGDDPGRVLWAPYVFENATNYGLVLLDDGQLIDTAAGEVVPQDATPMPVTSADDVAQLQQLDSAALQTCVVSHSTVSRSARQRIISDAGEGLLPPAGLVWEHGFTLDYWQLPPASEAALAPASGSQVLMVFSGRADVLVNNQRVSLAAGDVFSVPENTQAQLHNSGQDGCELFYVERA